MAENLAKVASAVAGVASVDERRENEDGISRASAILEEMESTDLETTEERRDNDTGYEQGS